MATKWITRDEVEASQRALLADVSESIARDLLVAGYDVDTAAEMAADQTMTLATSLGMFGGPFGGPFGGAR